jgi:c-di-GMP-binding flagellar brake protein YcgR
MSQGLIIDQDSRRSILHWASERQVPVVLSVLAEGRWCSLRSKIVQLERNLLQILYPMASGQGPVPEIAVGDELGISFRRGHKKCIFVSSVIMRRAAEAPTGEVADTLLVQVPERIRELQRRAYQRVQVQPERFIAVKVWEGGLPCASEPSWPLCAGRISNISVGGVLIDVRADQNPRLGLGDVVGLEITVVQGRKPLLVEGQYRHCTVTGPDRIGLGIQLLGLEHDTPGRASITDVAELVRKLMRDGATVAHEESD